jgi:predicted dehydrogenase
MIGHLITTTAESPGTNRLEIVGEMGKLVFEDGQLVFHHNQASMLEFIRTSPTAFDKVACQAEVLSSNLSSDAGHALVLEAFAKAVLRGGPPVAQAVEGLNSLMLGNAIMLSQFEGRPVELPLDGAAYAARLLERIEASAIRRQKIVD